MRGKQELKRGVFVKDIGLNIAIYLAAISLLALGFLLMFVKKTIPYEFLLGMLSSLTFFCGLITILGDFPYAIHLVVVGFVGLILSCGKIIYLFLSLLLALLKTGEKENVA